MKYVHALKWVEYETYTQMGTLKWVEFINTKVEIVHTNVNGVEYVYTHMGGVCRLKWVEFINSKVEVEYIHTWVEFVHSEFVFV